MLLVLPLLAAPWRDMWEGRTKTCAKRPSKPLIGSFACSPAIEPHGNCSHFSHVSQTPWLAGQPQPGYGGYNHNSLLGTKRRVECLSAQEAES